MPPSQNLSPGTVFAGEYRIDRLIGQGGMAQVFAAEQLTTGKMRALKLMHPTLVSDDEHKRRFLREARAGARIESDHVVEVFGAGVDQDTNTPFIVMELLTGETLYDRVKRAGPLSLAELAFVFKELAHATAAAHTAGVVHRDLKPENVFLAQTKGATERYTVKVLDFGIAKLVAEAGTKGTTGAMGSPLWMAPEQTEPGTVTPAADIWALGLIAFHSLTGRYFWLSARDKDATVTQLLREIIFDELPTASTRATKLGVAERLPRGFDAWFSKCVCRERESRFQDGKECGAAFSAFSPDQAGIGPSGSEFASTVLGDPMSVARIRSLPPSAAIRITPPRSADAIGEGAIGPTPLGGVGGSISRELLDTAPDTSPPMTPAPATPAPATPMQLHAATFGQARSQPPPEKSENPPALLRSSHPNSIPHSIPQGTPPPLSSSRNLSTDKQKGGLGIGPWILGSAALVAGAIIVSIVMLRQPRAQESVAISSGSTQLAYTRGASAASGVINADPSATIAAAPSASATLGAATVASAGVATSGDAPSSDSSASPRKIDSRDAKKSMSAAAIAPQKAAMGSSGASGGSSSAAGKKWQWKVSGHIIYVQSRTITVTGNVPVDVVRGAMDWDGWEYLRCYERDFKTADSLPQGTITLKFKIFDQLPRNGSIDRSDFTVPKFNDCVLRTALGQTANAAGSAGFADVSYTLAFTVGDKVDAPAAAPVPVGGPGGTNASTTTNTTPAP